MGTGSLDQRGSRADGGRWVNPSGTEHNYPVLSTDWR